MSDQSERKKSLVEQMLQFLNIAKRRKKKNNKARY